MKKNNIKEDSVPLHIQFVENPLGGFSGWIKDIPNVIAEGNTIDEIKHNLLEVLILHINENI